MAVEPITQVQNPGEPVQPTEPIEPVVTETIEELKAKLEKAELDNKAMLGRVSKQEKTLSTIQKEKEALELSKMDEVEKAQALAKKEADIAMSQTKKSLSESLGLDDEAAELLDSNNGEEMVNKADKLKTYKAAVLAEANDKIAALEKEIEVLKGEMPNPGRGNKTQEAGQMKRVDFEKLSGSEKMKAVVEDKISIID